MRGPAIPVPCVYRDEAGRSGVVSGAGSGGFEDGRWRVTLRRQGWFGDGNQVVTWWCAVLFLVLVSCIYSGVCVISYLYPATCSLKGYGSGSAAAEASAVGFFWYTYISCPRPA